MKVRQDAWTDENDLLLAETVLRHVREGSTQLNAFEEVGDKLNRTSAACGFRWNAVVRHRYEKALQLAKKQRKQRQRVLGKDQSGKKKLLYSPPAQYEEVLEQVPIQEGAETFVSHPATEFVSSDSGTESESVSVSVSVSEPVTEFAAEPLAGIAPVLETRLPSAAAPLASTGLTLGTVIAFLQNIDRSNFQVDILKSENERLKRENAELKRHNEELQEKVGNLEQNTVTIQEDYETLMKIMNRARKLVLFEEEERPATKFKMDRNGNLEKVAE